ncbi:MAG: LacI family transcriptional regulator [Verrucomicrobiae bacterium]|nr:LacI family transcriptional regulator [Verrucomicrobiae bacterium]
MITQEQIARKLGVSRQLVTFALAGYPQVSEASRRRILAAARELGYRPNPHARALKRRRTGIVALWVPDQISSHYNQVAREMNRLVKQAGHELITSAVMTAEAGEVLSHVPVDGVFAVDAPCQAAAYLASAQAVVAPLINMGAECCEGADNVVVDLASGTSQLMEHLLGCGFRRIAHMTYVRDDRPKEARRMEYLRAMRRAGLKAEFIYYPLSEQQRGIARQLIQDYVRERGCPEAIFCHSDDVAIGVYRGLLDMGISVPQQVALAGCDGIPDTEFLERPLTTLVQPVVAMCAAAWQLFQQRQQCPKSKRQQVILKPKLQLRESTGWRAAV